MPSRRIAAVGPAPRHRPAGGRRRPRPGRAGRTRPARRARSTWCRGPARSRPRRRSARVGRPAPGRTGRRRSGRPRPLQVVGQPVAEPVPVGGQAGDRRDQEERQEDVEQGDPRHHEGQPVEGQQQPGEAADQGRPGHPADQPDGDQDQQRAEDQRREPPAERVHPEHLLADGDQPLADRRVHDERRRVSCITSRLPATILALASVRPVPLVAELQQRVGVLGVVGLVEDQLVGIAEIDHPDHEGDGGDRQR